MFRSKAILDPNKSTVRRLSSTSSDQNNALLIERFVNLFPFESQRIFFGGCVCACVFGVFVQAVPQQGKLRSNTTRCFSSKLGQVEGPELSDYQVPSE
jgi:hypothetical protein